MTEPSNNYKLHLEKIVTNECKVLKSPTKCRHRNVAFIECMNQTTDNTRYCSHRAELLDICCDNKESPNQNTLSNSTK